MELTGIGPEESLLGEFRQRDPGYFDQKPRTSPHRSPYVSNADTTNAMGIGALSPLAVWPPIDDLDMFFSGMYNYYKYRGLPAIVLNQVVATFTLAFTIGFSVFLISCVDWVMLRECHDEGSCRDLWVYVRTPFGRASVYNFVAFCYMLLFCIYWIWQSLGAIRSIYEAIKMEEFYRRVLGITLADLNNMQWRDVVRRLITLHDSAVYRVTIQDKLTEHDVVSRIMRKENYMVALINNKVLDIRLPWWLVSTFSHPSAGLIGSEKSLFLTKSLEWSLDFCILQHMLNEHFNISSEFLRDGKALQYRFVTVGIVHFLLLPFMLVFMIIHFFLENAQHFRSNQSYLGPRQWSPLARWVFREYNELPHVFETRINLSYAPANKYVSLFKNGYAAILAKFVAYVSGSFVATLVLLSLFDEAILLYVRFSDHNLLWYLGIFSGIFAAAASLIPNETISPLQQPTVGLYQQSSASYHNKNALVNPAEEVMQHVAACTHHLPSHWMERCHTLQVRDEFLELFPFKTKLFAMEVLSVILTPLVLCFSLPRCVPDLLLFIRRHTVYVDGVGDICDYSTFDFDKYGNAEYMSPVNGHAFLRARTNPAQNVAFYAERDSYLNRTLEDMPQNGKLEQSYLSFRQEHPDWSRGRPEHLRNTQGDTSAISFGRRPLVNETASRYQHRVGTNNASFQQTPTAGDVIADRIQQFKSLQLEKQTENFTQSVLGRSISKELPMRNFPQNIMDENEIKDPRLYIEGVATRSPDQLYGSSIGLLNTSSNSRIGMTLPPLIPQSNTFMNHLGNKTLNINGLKSNGADPISHTLPQTPEDLRRESSHTSDGNTEVSAVYNSSAEGIPHSDEGVNDYSSAQAEHKNSLQEFEHSNYRFHEGNSYISDDDTTSLHESIGSILRSALKGEQMEFYENDFYWLNKYRAEQRRHSSGSVNLSTGLFTPPSAGDETVRSQLNKKNAQNPDAHLHSRFDSNYDEDAASASV